MKDKGDHDACSCVVDEPVAVNEVVDDEAVVCMYDLVVNEVVVDNAAVVDTTISEVMDAMAVDEGDDEEGVDDAMGVDKGDDNEVVVDNAMWFDEGDDNEAVVDDAMGVDEGDDDEAVDDEVVYDAMGVDGAVDDGEVVDGAVDDGEVVDEVVDDAMVGADAMVDDEEVVDEKLQLDVDTVVELHFHVLLLGIQSTENKRKCQENVPGHCKFPHRTNRPIIKLDCTQGLS